MSQEDHPEPTYLTHQEHVRARPGMYFGGSNQQAMHHLVYEPVRNCVNQYLQGHPLSLTVIIHDDLKVTVSDDGLGIPINEYQDTGRRILEIIVSQVGGRRLDSDTSNFRGGLFGVGLAAVNAVSEFFAVTVKRDGFVWYSTYAKGNVQTELTQVRPLQMGEATGTEVTFSPDFDVFEANTWDYQTLKQHLQNLAYLVEGLHITLIDHRVSLQEVFHFPKGVASYVEHLNRHYDSPYPLFHHTHRVKIDKKTRNEFF